MQSESLTSGSQLGEKPESIITAVADRVLVPLNQRTEDLVRPIHLQDNDFLEVDYREGHFVVRPFAIIERTIDGQHTRQYVSASYAAQRQWLLRVPERRDMANGTWKLGGTDFTALIIHSLWKPENLVFTEEGRQMYEYLLLRFFRDTLEAKKRAAFKIEGTVPENPSDFLDHPALPLSPYQLVAHHTTTKKEGCALFMEQGTGKTPIVIRRICHEAQKATHLYRVLVIVPKNIRRNWRNEVHRFATIPGRVAILKGGPIARIRLMADAFRPADDDDSKFSIVIASYETVRRSMAILLNGRWDWDLIVADESHKIKSWKAERTQSLIQLREKSKARIVMTGTPICNGIPDLFSQLEFLGEGFSGFSNKDNFNDFYGRYEKRGGGRGGKKLVDVQNLPILQERLARAAFFMTKKEALPDLPDKVYDVIEATMTGRQRKIYIEAAEQIVKEVEKDLEESDGKSLTINNILTKLLRLAQITAGYVKWDGVYDDDGNVVSEGTIEHLVPNPKIDILIETLREKEPDQKTIIWCCFVPAIHEICRALEKEGIRFVKYYGGTSESDRAYAETAFNEDPAVKVFVGNPAAGGVGLNLWGYVPDWAGTPKDHGCNCDHVIYYASNWSYPDRSQSEDRAHRRGTRTNVRISDLIVPDTIDETIMTRVLRKKMTAFAVQDVKEILQALIEIVPDEEGDD